MNNNSTRLILLFILGIGILSLTRTMFLLWNTFLPDLVVFIEYSRQLLQGINPYETEHIFSPPVALLLFSPLIIFSATAAQQIWLLSSIMFFIASLFLLKDVFKFDRSKLIILFTLTVVSFPFKFTLGMGQTNILILFFISLFLYFFMLKKEKLGVVFLSLAIVLKLFPSILVMELIFLRKWKVIGVLALTLFTLFLIPIILTGKFVNFYHMFNILIPLATTPPTITVYYDQSVTGLLARYDVPTVISNLIRIGLMLITFFFAYRHKEKPLYAFVLLLTGFLLTNKFTWQHQLILLIPTFSYFLAKRLSQIKEIFLATSYVLMMINIKNPSIYETFYFGNLWLTHGLHGIFILWIMLIIDHEADNITRLKAYIVRKIT